MKGQLAKGEAVEIGKACSQWKYIRITRGGILLERNCEVALNESKAEVGVMLVG